MEMLIKGALKAKIIGKNNKGYLILLIKEIIHCYINMINSYALDNRTSKYIQQKLIQLKGEMNISSLIMGDFITLSGGHRSNRKKKANRKNK